MDNRSDCTPTTSHDYVPDPPDPRQPRIRTATCRHCRDVLTVTHDPT